MRRVRRLRLHRLSLALVVALAAMLLAVTVAAAAEIRSGDRTDVGADEVIENDLYLFGGTVVMAGTVRGDVVAAGGTVRISGTVEDNLIVAGGTVLVSGTVRGDVFAAGGSVTISGTVQGDVRAAGGQVVLAATGSAREDFLVAGGSFEAERGSTTGGDVLLGAGSGTLAGAVNGRVEASSERLRIFGTIGGDVEATADRVSLGPEAEVTGAFTYTSRRQAEISSGAVVRGAVTHEVPRRRVLFFEGPDSPLLAILARILGQLRWFAATALLGLALLWLFPRFTAAAHETLRASPWRSLGLGLTLLILYPIVALLVGILAMIVTGWAGLPFLLTPLLPWIAALFLAAVVAGLTLGVLLLGWWGRGRALRLGYALLAGLAVLAMIDLVPIIGGITRVLVIVLGVGGVGLALLRLYTRGRAGAAV